MTDSEHSGYNTEDEAEHTKYYDKIDGPRLQTLGDIFSEYGGVRWILLDKRGELSQNEIETLLGLGWETLMVNVYRSPSAIQIGGEDKILQQAVTLIGKKDHVEIAAAYASLFGKNF